MAPRPPSSPSEFLSPKQVAVELGVSIRSVHRLIDRRELRVHRIGRLIRVSREDFAAYLARQRR